MANKSTTTGLGGRSNFFKGAREDEVQNTPQEDVAASSPTPTAPAPSSPALPATKASVTERKVRKAQMTTAGKVRTTVTLYPETLAAMEQIKTLSRRKGLKESFSDVLEAAIQALAKERGVRL